MKYFNKLLILFICLFFALNSLSAQNKQVREALRNVASGKITEAQSTLDDLLNKYPVDPGIVFLQATLTSDADQAISLYRKILNEFTKSEWSDDAYWRLVQYYAIKGDTISAVKALEQFKTFQPLSEYLPAAKDVVYISLMYNRENPSSDIKNDKIKEKLVNPNEIKKDNQVKISEDTKKPKIANSETQSTVDSKKITVKEPSLIVKNDQNKDEKKLRWALQVGVFSTLESAKSECDKFQKKRLKNKIVEKDIDGKKMFAVIIGNYKSRDKAEEERATVEKICGCETVLYGY